MSIDLNKHHAPTNFLDKLAYWTVKLMRVPTDVFFQVSFIYDQSTKNQKLDLFEELFE